MFTETPTPRERPFQSTPRVLITPAIVGLDVLVFAAMVLTGVSALAPEAAQLIDWGANYGPLTLDREWWRLLSAAFVHIGLIHLAFNMQCLWSLGKLAEHLFGHGTFLMLYLLCGIGGSIASVWWSPTVVGAGASGAIFGVAGGLAVFLYKGRPRIPRAIVKRNLTSVLLFMGYNLVFGFTQSGIDNAAHLGGLGTGLVMGGLLARSKATLDTQSRRPQGMIVSTMVLLLVLGAALVKYTSKDPLLDRERAYAQYNQGMDYLEQNRLDLAIEAYTQALDLYPDMVQAYVNRGVAYLRANRLPSALADFDRAIELDPEKPEAVFNRGIVYVLLGQFDRALIDLTHAVADYPDEGEVLFFRGIAYAQLGEAEQALEDLHNALELGLGPDLRREAENRIVELSR